MADLRRALSGGIVALTVAGDRTAAGHFLPGHGSFMPLRHDPNTVPPTEAFWTTDDPPVVAETSVAPEVLAPGHDFRFVAQWHLPDVTWSPSTADGRPGLSLRASDGSRTSVYTEEPVPAGNTNRRFRVSQSGPRRLWDTIEAAHRFWVDAGRPTPERFGCTVTPEEQYVWLDRPDGEHRWELSGGTG